MEMIEEDHSSGLTKVHPLFDWTLAQVMEYLDKNNVPYNSLHHKGFVSIGCEPCTRAVKPGEDFRAGRITSYNVCYTKLLRIHEPDLL